MKVHLGEIWLARLDPSEGSEQAGTRPVVVVSGNLMNEYMKIVLVCPLTSKIKDYRTNIVLDPSTENGLMKESEVLTVHIRSISKNRLIKKRGFVTNSQIALIHERINDVLTM